jgi:uncharacterized protein YndB with AHSA1/START domain
MTGLRSIEVDQYFPHPPETVWRALTEPALIARWLMPNDFAAAIGHRFTLRTEPVAQTGFGGVIECEVLELVPLHRLRISWNSVGSLESTVTWSLQAEGRGTRLLLEHAGFDPDDPNQLLAFQIMNGGWRSHVLRRLTEVLAAIAPPSAG